MTENGGDIFVKENPKVEGAQKMFDGEFCSLQVLLKQLSQNWHNSTRILSGTLGYRSCQGSQTNKSVAEVIT